MGPGGKNGIASCCFHGYLCLGAPTRVGEATVKPVR